MNQLTAENTWNQWYKMSQKPFKQLYSQHREDGIIEYIFSVCKPKNKICVEVGAADGKTISNTYNLILQDWEAVQIEKAYETLKDGVLFSGYRKMLENHKDHLNVTCVNEALTDKNLDDILDKYNIPQNYDLLSLDIDSFDAQVWTNMRRKPNLVAIECYEGSDSPYTSSYDFNRSGGMNSASIGFLKLIALKKGYTFVCAEVCNAFFIESKFGEALLT